MAYYNANLVLGLTRKALGITQEKLSEGICEVETYSRIENGHHSVKKSTYQKLMKKMGRMAETRYAVCMAADGVLLEERVELERAIKRYDYEAAERYLDKMKESADDNLLTRQYIARMDALIEYHEGEISSEALIERLSKAMQITAPEYEVYLDLDRVFPFVKPELLLLMNIGNAYRRKGNLEEGLKVYGTVLRCLQVGYVGEPDRTTLEIAVRNGISMVHEAQERNREALAEVQVCLELAATIDYGYFMPTLLSGKAFNIIRMVEKKELEDERLEEAKRLSRQAYYIASARGDVKTTHSINEFYRCSFEEWIEQ